MSQQQHTDATVSVDITNIGGIDRQTLEFDDGVTVLIGENSTNRTSMLRSIMAACGSDRAYLKADTGEGKVSLTIGDNTYIRTFERTSNGVATDGSPLLTGVHRIKAADYYAFLLADNQARRSVVNPEADFRDIVMGPVDTAAIDEQIENLQDELQAVNQAIDRCETLQTEKLPTLEEYRVELQAEIDEIEEQIKETEAEIEEADKEVEKSKEQQEKIDSLTSDIRNAREDRDRFDLRVENEEDALTEARNEYEDVQKELEALDVPGKTDRAAMEQELIDLRNRRDTLNEEINTLTSITSFNKKRLSGDSTISDAVAAALGGNPKSETGSDQTAEDLTQQLSAPPSENKDQTRCWTCGQQAARVKIEETTNALREEVQARQATRADIVDEIAELEDGLNAYEEKKRENQRLEQRVASIEATIEETKDRIATLEDKREDAAERVKELEDQADELKTNDEAYSRVIDLHSKITKLETEHQQKVDDLSEIEAEIENVQEEITELEGIEMQRDELEAELEEQKRRIELIQEEVVEGFNENMDILLEKLSFENIERVWLERRQEAVRQGRPKVEEPVFVLHVVRQTADGTIFEDTKGVEHLSESERNVVGLVFALAGYLAHEVYEDVPFMLLDSMEAMDAKRIAKIIEHFSQHAHYLVAALLPETQEPLLTDVDPGTVIRVDSVDG